MTYRGFTSLDQVAASFWSKVDKSGDCWLWTASRCSGGMYGQFRAAHFPGATTAHRWSWFLAYGHFPQKEIGHRCHNGLCVRPDHLEEVTRLKNEQDKTSAGRRPRGVKDTPCRKCGGPREGRSKRADGREFGFCIPCRQAYMASYRK